MRRAFRQNDAQTPVWLPVKGVRPASPSGSGATAAPPACPLRTNSNGAVIAYGLPLCRQVAESAARSLLTDPCIQRFDEIVGGYGPTLKSLIHEKFGDGIMSRYPSRTSPVTRGRSACARHPPGVGCRAALRAVRNRG
ncbi:hypothetical protein [Tropicimonas marinistellae]|uniref:cyanase n=1 Tax=Tropicimonas marinistellae TaxID=1739787 RepID=UPI00098EB1C6|nr:hypothetical protein [Tropicimonas marinistellae]